MVKFWLIPGPNSNYNSMVDPEETTVYTCRILDSGQGTPIFEIEPGDQPGVKIAAGTATGAWAQVFKTANKIRNRVHSNSVSGPDYYGLGQSTIKALIQELPGASELPDYVMQNYVEAGSGAAKMAEKDADDYEPAAGSGKKPKKGKQGRQSTGGAAAGGKKGARKSGAGAAARADTTAPPSIDDDAGVDPSDPTQAGAYYGGDPRMAHQHMHTYSPAPGVEPNEYYAASGATTPGGRSISDLLHPVDPAAQGGGSVPAIDPSLQASAPGAPPQHRTSPSPYASPTVGYGGSYYPPSHGAPPHQNHPGGGYPGAQWTPPPPMAGQPPYHPSQQQPQQQHNMYATDPAFAQRSRSTSDGSH
jgi:hypothetical protein